MVKNKFITQPSYKKKIIITGGLGYIGFELCKIYSGESWNNEIIVIDKNFFSKRVNQLSNWNINFFQGDILDKNFINYHLKDADVIHHLAGITDVAYVKKDKDKKSDALIRATAVDGTQNVIDAMKNNAKIIFPSTHVIFEGLPKTKNNILENEKPLTFLTYASSKVINENQLKSSKKNYIILRLGSVYGYSEDSTRVNIMPNFFSKIASQNGIIKLFSGGKQIKSLVPLVDVARCFKFMEEANFINEVYNLTKERVTVKKVAELCKKINPKLKLVSTKDKIPNKGYTLSNKKLLKTGFKFLYDLEENIKEMIHKWSNKKLITELEYVKSGENSYIDSRGKINNYELPESINLIGLIDSKKGTIRANHYHPQQEQKCLFTKGQIIEVFQDLLNANAPKITQVVNEGELSIIKPNVAHAMIFNKDTTFLNLVRGERDHENYGITHTIRKVIVNEDEKNLLLSCYKFDCRSCNNTDLKRVISLGYQPLANNLLNKKEDYCELYPLELNYCPNCHNCQLSVAVDPNKMFLNYLYTSSTSKSFREHFVSAAKKYIEDFKLNKKSLIIDVGSNDGVALKPFKDLGYKNILGIEPAANLARLANKNKIKTFNGFLEEKNLRKLKKNANLILASNVFAHSDKLKEMTDCMIELLGKNGVLIIEVQYLLKMLKDLTFDNIYHEHYNYWSLTSLVNFFKQFKLKIFKAEIIYTHGGSLRIYLSKNKKIKIDKSINKILKNEENYGIKKFDTYKKFSEKIYKIKENVIRNIKNLKEKNKNLIGYGAPAKATTALNFFGITNEINYIIEDNKLKYNKFIPGVNIPIVSKIKINDMMCPIIVLAWNFFTDIKKNNSHLKGHFINIKDLEIDKKQN
jgi:nucleoside-diphosphate-sugar epimerase/quercetin dioxygenase-like cupin family protein